MNKYEFFIAGRARNKENILRICDLFDKYKISYYCFLKNEDDWGYGNENQTPEEKQQEFESLGLKSDIGTISLEPGSQIELSLKPFDNLKKIHGSDDIVLVVIDESSILLVFIALSCTLAFVIAPSCIFDVTNDASFTPPSLTSLNSS